MRNLIKYFDKIPDSTKGDGLIWYQKAHEFCQRVADQYQLDLAVVCAIVSALSPMGNWEQNKRDAVRLIETNKGIGDKGYRFVTYGQNVLKAQDVYRGNIDPFKAFSPNTGPKTYNFFHNLLYPNSLEHVTVDRHMVRVVTPDSQSDAIRGKQYKLIADHIKKAAEKLSLVPANLQAILWLDYREQNVNKFKVYDVPF